MEIEFVYPRNEYDQPSVLLELLGTFWSDTYPDQLVEDLMVAYALAARQTHSNMLELINACSRFDVPVYHQEQWYHLVLKESDHNTEAGTSLSVYGSGIVYGNQPDGTQLKYGVPWFPYSVFPLPGGLISCPFVFNRITQPSVNLVLGVDYVIDLDNEVIVFKDNPFENDLVSSRDIYVDGEVTDREVSLWLFRPRFDAADIHTQFAYPFRFELDSTQTYKDCVNSIWDGLVRGSAVQDIQGAVSAICDIPIVKGTETVEVIQKDSSYLLIVTDQNVYRFHQDATATVSVGDTVHAGDTLTDALQFFDFNRGDYGNLNAISIGRGFLPAGYYDSITFYNETADLEVDTSGIFTKISFHVGGWPGDVEKFWDDFHERGVAAGQTLAHLLDQRTNKTGEPTASNLPSTINPLEFLSDNVLRNNAFATRIKYNLKGPNAVSLQHLRQLRRLIVPSTTMLVIAELAAPDDVALLTEYVAEEQEPYLGSEPYAENMLLPSYVEEEVTLQYVDGYCI